MLLFLCWGVLNASVEVHAQEAALQNVIQLESRFQQILQTPSPALVIQDDIQTALAAKYHERQLGGDFQADVHELALKADKDPHFSVVPVSLESYQKLRLVESIAQSISTRIVYDYSRLIQTTRDQKMNVNVQLKATMALNQVDETLVRLPWEDQLQLGELIGELRAMRMWDSTSLNQVQVAPNSKREQMLFKMRLQGSKQIMQAKSSTALQMSPRLQKLLAAKMKEGLNGQGLIGPATPIAPGAGKEGNFDGYHLPEGTVALTFDDGPSPFFTEDLMDILEAHHDKLNPAGAPASFFWLAGQVTAYPEIAQRAVREHFSTNCHSWSHKQIPALNDHGVQHEVVDAVRVEEQIFGRPVRFFRCPYGSCVGSPRIRNLFVKMDIVHVFWSIDSLDWLFHDASATFINVTEQLKIAKRGIVLMHDVHPFSVEAASRVLAWIKQQNDSGQHEFRLYTVDDAMALQNQAAKIQTSSAFHL